MIKEHFEESIRVKQQAYENISDVIASSVESIVHALKKNKKLLICGNGGSAADAQHFSAELMNRFEKERKPLPAIALTTDSSTLTSIANDYSYDDVFSKQIEALGNEDDILIAISTSGNSLSILNAINIALSKKMTVIALTGSDGGKLSAINHERFVAIHVPSARTARIQEVHILIIHVWCAYIDKIFCDN